MTGMHYDYLIVGAGISGAAFAYEASQAGKTCLVIDRRAHIAGNCYTEKIAEIDVHCYGPHIFHTSDRELWNYICRFSEFLPFINSPLANYKGEIYNLPFNMNTFSKMWNVFTPSEAQDEIARQCINTEFPPDNLEAKALSMVGKDIYEKLIKGYTEKHWGRPCSQLPPEILGRLPLRFTYNNNYFDDIYQGIPKGGYTALIKKMLSDCDVILDVDFCRDKEKYFSLADKVIYTGMIDEYFNYCYGELEYRSLRFETELLPVENYQGVAVVNYTDAETPYTRCVEHKHFENGRQASSVISREYPCAWSRGQEAYYPINDRQNMALFDKYKELANKERNVEFLGRLAKYKYLDMDDALAESLALAYKEFGHISADMP